MALRARRYFRDYELREERTDDGRSRRKLVYCGDWYQRGGSRRQQRTERWSYVLLGTAAAVALLYSMLRPIEANVSGRLVQSVSLLAMIPAFCVLEGSVEALFRRGALKKENYRTRLLMLRIMALAGCGLNLLLCAGYGVYCFRAPGEAETLTASILTGVNALFYGAIGVNELRVRYSVVKAPPRALRDGERPDEGKRYFD